MKVSIVMAVYNGEVFLENSLTSILSQLNPEDEIIIINDASTDQSLDIIHSLQDSRISIIQNERNQGVNISFLKGLYLATGQLIFIADQDDTWKENKVEYCRELFHQHSIGLLVHNGTIFQYSKPTGKTIFEINKSGKGFWKNFRSDTYVGCCMVMRGDIRHQLLPKAQFRNVMYDHYLGLMAELKNVDTLFTDESLIEYHRHGNNLTDIGQRRNLGLVVWDRIRLGFMLIINRWL